MSTKITTKDQNIMSVNAQMELGFQEGALINVLLGKSFADELKEWRRDFDVVDDGVIKILNKKSRELPNIKKVSKIWGGDGCAISAVTLQGLQMGMETL